MSHLYLIKNDHSLIYLRDLNLYYQPYFPLYQQFNWEGGGVILRFYDT